MVFSQLPTQIDQIEPTKWETYEPFYGDLLNRTVDQETVKTWLSDWSRLEALVNEAGTTIHIQKTLDTRSAEKERAFIDFVSNVQPHVSRMNQKLKEKLLQLDSSEANLENFDIILRNMRNQADLFSEENVPILTELSKLGNEYDKVTGSLTTDWNGEEKNLSQLQVFLKKKDRSIREKAWRSISNLWLGQREALDGLYIEMLSHRKKLAKNAGLENFRDFTFRDYDRFDYSVEDCLAFHEAIEKVVVPAATKIYRKKRKQLGLKQIRPWDVDVDTTGADQLTPYSGQEELVKGGLNILQTVDPGLAHYFTVMAEEELLDLDTRTGKALGGYCAALPLRQRPFIFMNGTGTHDDVQTLLHEAGHAFHVFEAASLPYIWQHEPPMEFAEVASMSMELLSAPYLSAANGGFYSKMDASRARIEHLEGILLFLPYMAVVDGFQHWIYSNPQTDIHAKNCDQKWAELWKRFIPGVDYSGFEAEMETGWHRKLHIFHVPFYYIEYGLAQIGALQIWRNAMHDQGKSVTAYRQALSLGGTRTLPELFNVAGVEFQFDESMLVDMVNLIETTIEELEASLKD